MTVRRPACASASTSRVPASAPWSCPRCSKDRADETFIDAVCDPPETFTYGGLLAHVLTFAAVRRTMAIGALETAGVTDLGSGDPMRFVGGSGADASTIQRTPADD